MLRVGVLLYVLLLVAAPSAEAATTLYLPRQFSPAEMATIGVALVNPTTGGATVTFRLRTASGTALASTPGSVPAKGQYSATLGQLFPQASEAGWLSVESDVDQVTGFWLAGDFVTSTDGAQLLSTSQAIAFPVFTYLASATEISFANAGTATLTGSLILRNAGGTTVGTHSFSLPPSGLFQDSVTSLFPGEAAGFDSAGYSLTISSSSSTARVVGTSMTAVSGRDNLAVNAAWVSYTDFGFPHVVGGSVGGANYTTVLTLTNFRTTSQTVALTLTQTTGARITLNRTIPARGVLQTMVTSLFGLTSVDGWLLVDANEAIGGLVTYTDTVNGGSTAVEMQGAGDSSLVFGHIADLPPWWTGIALANPTSVNAHVEVYAFDAAGNLIGGPAQSSKAAFTLNGGAKTAFLLGDLIPQTQTRSTDGGYVLVRTVNGVQIYGTELFFLRSGKVYSSVPATRVGTLGFAAPGATTGAVVSGGTVYITKVYTGTSEYTVHQQSFRPGETLYMYMVTNNTTGQDVASSKTYRATGPAGNVIANITFNATTRAGNNWIYSGSQRIPSGTPSGVYTFTGTHTWNGVVSTLATTFRIESDITISGNVYAAPTPAYPFVSPLANAAILIVGNNANYTATTNANGAYSVTLPLSLRDQTMQVVMQVSANGYVPQGVALDLTRGGQTVNVTLEPDGPVTIVETALHHLGDSSFSTTLNAGLQRLTAEGLAFTKNFTVAANLLPPNNSEATLQITVNGSERNNPVTINGTVVAGLNNSQVGPQTYYYSFPISVLRAGSNTLVIRANPDDSGGYDDFEFANILIRFSNPAILR